MFTTSKHICNTWREREKDCMIIEQTKEETSRDFFVDQKSKSKLLLLI